MRARPAARHTTSHLQKPASASCADSKAMASSAIGRAHRVSSSFVVGPGRPRLVRTREEHYFSERFSPASCPATHTRGPLGVDGELARLGGFREILRFEVNCDMERATEYVAELWNSGWGDLQPVTELPRRGKDRIRAVISKAFCRYKSAILDVYNLRGPVARSATQV